MAKRREARNSAETETAARLFTQERMSYGQIAKQLGITKDQAKSKVKAGLRVTPQMAHQERKATR